MHPNYRYADESPYPPVRVCEKNPAYANEMLANIGSCGSEISAVTQYFYNSIVLESCAQELAECFHRISIIEMRHLHIFAELALELGADPRLWSRTKRGLTYWNPSCNQYCENAAELARGAAKGEQAAIAQYRCQAERIQDPEISAILRRIILDEECHMRIFESFLRTK